jgi:catechol 2,3-dioxygenase-like lactoylglutathione lyase family enzyme
MITRRGFLRLGGTAAVSGAALALVGCDDESGSEEATGTPALTPPQTEVASGAIVRQVDHILLRTDDAQRVFSFFTEALALPVAWPLFTYRGFTSGAVGFGSVNLEILQPVEGDTPAFARAPGTYPIGIAFEPIAVESAVRELDARGIGHSVPFEDGINEAIRWTSIDLTGPAECPVLLLVKYGFDQEARRAGLGREVVGTQGGPLGVIAPAELELGVQDLDAAMARWGSLLGQVELEGDARVWRGGSGPLIRFSASDDDHFERIIMYVHSLDRARRTLNDLRALVGEGADWIDLGFEDSHAPIRLVEPYTR